MPNLADIYDLLQRSCGVRSSELAPHADLERDLQITGDDFFELMQLFAKEFSVNLEAYRWYFHHSEEVTFNPGALLFMAPYRQVPHIPITPTILLEAAQSGRWIVSYPEHTLAKRRHDIMATYGFFAVLGLAVAVMVFRGKSGA